MFFKFFEYSLENDDGKLPSETHRDIFRKARGFDEDGLLVKYRGQRNSILMGVRKAGDFFTGLIGRHSEQRDVTDYDANEDAPARKTVDDDDYPNTPFVCWPKKKGIAICDSAPISAGSAVQRLHAILYDRAGVEFSVTPIKEFDDLRFATNNLRIIEISFETVRVNPHTEALGMAWNESAVQDHVTKVAGKLVATSAKPVELNGGIATQIQQLQKSGHCRVGYTGLTPKGVKIKTQKPRHLRALPDDDSEIPDEQAPDVRVKFDNFGKSYPLEADDISRVADALSVLLKMHRTRMSNNE